MAQPQICKLGKSTILVHDDEFKNGYSSGLFSRLNQTQPLTIEAIGTMIQESITDVSQTEDWNTGYIAGAICGLHEGTCKPHEGSEAARVYIGSLRLDLNRWRFREGYYTGHQAYTINQSEHTATGRLTACELLNSVAHYDTSTDRYHFGEEELACLEDALGQLVGYICAALFPTQVHDTQPLPLITLQEA